MARRIWRKWRYSSPAPKSSKISRTVLEIFQSFLYDRILDRVSILAVLDEYRTDLLQKDEICLARTRFLVAPHRLQYVGDGEIFQTVRGDTETLEVVGYCRAIVCGKNAEQLGYF